MLFDRQPIFLPEDRARVRWLPLHVVDWLHVDTRVRVLRRELVFRQGDCLDPALLEESERKLRSTGFLAESSIVVVPVAADTVDVLVRTREVWTTTLDFRYERYESQPLWSLRLAERNVLGSGSSLEVARGEDVDRTSWTFGLGSRQLFDGHWRGRFLVVDSSDGGTTSWSLAHPFFRIGADWGFSTSYSHSGQRPRFYLTGTQYVRPHSDQTRYHIDLRRRVLSEDDAVWHVGMGLSLQRQGYNPEAGLEVNDADGALPAAFDFGPDLREQREVNSLEWIVARRSSQFIRERFLYQMGRIEDLALGHDGELSLGWASPALGSTRHGMTYALSDQWTAARGRSIFRSRLSISGLHEFDASIDVRNVAELDLYVRAPRGWTLAAGVVGGLGSQLDRDAPFTLGIDSGLRSARFREFAGDRILRGNLEARWVYRRGVLDLATPGVVVFGDVGTAWFEDETDVSLRRLRGAVGFGLRVGLNRSAINEPIRLDVAWPLLYSTDRQAPVLSVGMGHVF